MLTKKEIAFQEIDVSHDPKMREEIAQRSGQHTVPQIFIGDKPVGGFMELQSLELSGELDDLLRGQPPEI